MNIHIAGLVADYAEPRLESLAQAMIESFPPKERENVQHHVLPWLQDQINMLRGQPFRTREWVAALGKTLTLMGEDFSTLIELGRCARETATPFFSGKISGVDDYQLHQLATEIFDLHIQQSSHFFAQRMRDIVSVVDRRQRAIIDTLGRSFLLLDGRGYILMANNECARDLNTPPESLVGRDFLALCSEETAQELRRHLRQRKPTMQKHIIIGRLSEGVPGSALLRFQVQPMYDAEGKRDGSAVSFEPDASPILGMNDILDYVRDRIIAILPIPAQLFDEAGDVICRNESARFYEFSDNPRDLPFCCYFHQRHGATDTPCMCRQVFRNGIPHSEDVRIDDQDKTRWFRVGIMPIVGPDGRVAHVACGILDLTAQKRIEKQMENQLLAQQRSSLVSQIALTVAQQLRNPLGVVIGFAELLSKGLPPEQNAEVVSRILRNSLRCKEIVEDLLDFGQGTPLDRVAVDLCIILRDSVQPMLTNAQNRCIEWRIPAESMFVQCVPTQLAQVMMSLIDNAVCFVRKRAVCEVYSENGCVCLSVADDGPGIPEELAEQVFEPFFTTRRVEGAVGLGLSLARSVVRDYGGDLFVARDKEPELPGARMVIRLPLADMGRVETGEGSKKVDSSRPLRALIVDDETDLLDMLATALHMRGIETDLAPDGITALKYLQAGPHDVVVIDFNLPGEMSGRGLFAQIQKEYPETVRKVLFITADTLNFETHRFLETVNNPSLEKPFLITDFLNALEELVKKPLKTQHSR